MAGTLGVPEGMLKQVSEFVEAKAISLRVVGDGDCTVRVVQSEERLPSTPAVLHTGGWIACATARSMAGKLGIKPRDMGKLLNHLDIKIRNCELGCFE